MPSRTETLQKKIAVLKGKVCEGKQAKKSLKELRELKKSLKHAQRKVRFLTGKKLRALMGVVKEEKPAGEQPKQEAPKTPTAEPKPEAKP
ncbi:MAG: hypothetical protein AAB019_00180 [Planctomycetota bacterium]